MSSQTPQRAVVLFDGPNFYKNLLTVGLERGHLDYFVLARNLAGPRILTGVIFYTSPVDQQAEPENYANQQRFFVKLQASGVELRLGTLVPRSRECSKCGAMTEFKVEKSLDVQIAMELILGCVHDKYDVAYLATCDADLVPAIEYVRSQGKDVFLLWPVGSKCYAVDDACRVTIPIKQETLNAAQNPL